MGPIAPTDLPPPPRHDPWLMAELRSDHAGETGAVAIYQGILAVSRDKSVRDFAERHLVTEAHHLVLMDALVPRDARSRLLPLWRVAGWLTGALPALFGPRAVFITIEAVECFVDEHYGDQIDRLEAENREEAIRAVLVQCREEEIYHMKDAASRYEPPRTWSGRAWAFLIDKGSRGAVGLARRI